MGGKKKQAARAPASSDDEILDAAIAANKQAAAEAAAVAASPATASASEDPSAAKPAALTRQDIISKLNAVPTFCVLNGDSNIVAMEDPDGAGEVCTWFTDAEDARRMLASAKEQNPDVAAELHLGVTPLGLALALALGWAESLFVGELRLQGKPEVVGPMTAALRGQVEAQGEAPGGWVLPTFCCDELQSPTIMPVFLSRADLVAAWVASGRSRETVPAQLAVIELRVLVAQMQTDAFAWSTVVFVGSPRAADLVREAKVAAAVIARRRELAAAKAGATGAPPPLVQPAPAQAGVGGAGSGEEPPPLISDDDPPPLE